MNEKTTQPGRYRHYKGNEYEVLGCARHTETDEELVVYWALCGDRQLCVRPNSMFEESVVVRGKSVSRFTFIGPGQVE